MRPRHWWRRGSPRISATERKLHGPPSILEKLARRWQVSKRSRTPPNLRQKREKHFEEDRWHSGGPSVAVPGAGPEDYAPAVSASCAGGARVPDGERGPPRP